MGVFNTFEQSHTRPQDGRRSRACAQIGIVVCMFALLESRIKTLQSNSAMCKKNSSSKDFGQLNAFDVSIQDDDCVATQTPLADDLVGLVR